MRIHLKIIKIKMDNIIKKFYAYNSEDPKNVAINNDLKSSFYKSPKKQFESVIDKNQERIKTMEERLIKIENKKIEEKNDIYNLIKSNLVNNSTSYSRTNNQVKRQYLPDIYNNKSASRRRIQRDSSDFTNNNM